MLESILGDNGAVVAQFLVILVFILILTGVAYWLFQRNYGSGLAGSARSRVPRLGVIDSLAIDPRHRLVLVRRDNVEHLLLIGKSADLVVESTIIRAAPAEHPPQPRKVSRPQPQMPSQPKKAPPVPQRPPPSPTAAPNQPPPTNNGRPRAQASGISQAISFRQEPRPQPRQLPRTAAAEPNVEGRRGQEGEVQQAVHPQQGNTRKVAATVAVPSPAAAASATTIEPASAHFEEPAHPTRVEPVFSPGDSLDEISAEPTAKADQPLTGSAEPTANAVIEAPASVTEPPSEDQSSAVIRTAEISEPTETAPDGVSERSETEPDTEPSDEDRATTVSNLEQEMARLLGEITAKRDG